MAGPEDLTVEYLRARPHPAEQVDRVLDGGWPAFIGADAEAERHLSRVRDVFGDHELVLVAGAGTAGEELVALGWAVPLRWSGAVADLPAGYTDSLGRALADLDASAATDTTVVCAVQVRSDAHGRGLAARLLAGFVEHAARSGHERVVAPLRPTGKHAYPLTPIDEYVTWTDGAGDPFDPWIRTHRRMGAEVLATAPRSQTMTGTVAQWEAWTGMRLPATGAYVIPGGLAPLEVDLDRDLGTYVEPNVWVRHR
jgi:GNAT superfamily N-acetyltransferase